MSAQIATIEDLHNMFNSIKSLLIDIHKQKTLDDLLTPDDVEKEYNIKTTTQNKLRSNRKITYHRASGSILYYRKDVLAYIESNKFERI